MPRFYFEFLDGFDLIHDDGGLELDSLKAAEHEAVQTAVQLGRDWLPRKREIRLVVRNDHRQPVMFVNLELTVERLMPSRVAGSSGSQA
jgi:hypothetical protein